MISACDRVEFADDAETAYYALPREERKEHVPRRIAAALFALESGRQPHRGAFDPVTGALTLEEHDHSPEVRAVHTSGTLTITCIGD